MLAYQPSEKSSKPLQATWKGYSDLASLQVCVVMCAVNSMLAQENWLPCEKVTIVTISMGVCKALCFNRVCLTQRWN